MTEHMELRHKLISIPKGKKPDDIVQERHDIVLLFDATKSNPNGDPDLENMPRRQPDTLKGLVTDVCLKRKIRNFFSLYTPDEKLIIDETKQVDGYDIFIRENAILQDLMECVDIATIAKKVFKSYKEENKGRWEKPKRGERGKTEFIQRSYRDALCKKYFDIRTFGGVVSTDGPLKGTFFGQIRGPIQFSFSESLDKVLQLDATITRCCVASKKEADKLIKKSGEKDNRTMGRQYRVDYGLYRTHIFFSPAFAAKTGFTYYDLDNFFFALTNMFRDDVAGPRTGMRVVGLIDFQHSSCLGNEHAHKLFKLVDVHRKEKQHNNIEPEDKFPNSIEDYCGTVPKNGTLIKEIKDGKFIEVDNQNNDGKITVKHLVWEIPVCPKSQQ